MNQSRYLFLLWMKPKLKTSSDVSTKFKYAKQLPFGEERKEALAQARN
jgi:hypothetical protein